MPKAGQRRESGSPQRPGARAEPRCWSSPPGTRAPRRSAGPASRARRVGPQLSSSRFSACGIAMRTDFRCPPPPPRPPCCPGRTGPRSERVEQPAGKTRETAEVLILQTSNVAGRTPDPRVTAVECTGAAQQPETRVAIPAILCASYYKIITSLRPPSSSDMSESPAAGGPAWPRTAKTHCSAAKKRDFELA
jgi:hypothetical protein